MTDNTLSAVIGVSSAMLGGILGFMAAIFAEPVRRLIYRPSLKLEFDSSEGCNALTPEGIPSTHKAYYIRVKVTNMKPTIAEHCRAYLVAIDKKDETSNRFVPTIYCDSIQLAWSCRKEGEAYTATDLSKGLTQFVDLVSTRDDINYYRPAIYFTPFRYMPIFQEQGTFRFTVQVSGGNFNPKLIRVVFDWHGVWDKYTARCSQA